MAALGVLAWEAEEKGILVGWARTGGNVAPHPTGSAFGPHFLPLSLSFSLSLPPGFGFGALILPESRPGGLGNSGDGKVTPLGEAEKSW